MPSPVGHALGGMAAGWVIAGVRRDGRAWLRTPWLGQALLFATLGMLPDIDFLFGTHSTYTHSIGAAAILGAIAFAMAKLQARGHAAAAHPSSGASPASHVALACALAYASHIVLDGLGDDTTPPIGIMAFWPLTSEFYQSDLRWFMAISRRYWLPGFWTHNLLAVLWEIVIMCPVALGVFWLRRQRGSR